VEAEAERQAALLLQAARRSSAQSVAAGSTPRGGGGTIRPGRCVCGVKDVCNCRNVQSALVRSHNTSTCLTPHNEAEFFIKTCVAATSTAGGGSAIRPGRCVTHYLQVYQQRNDVDVSVRLGRLP
jgi:hypothetical protein